MAQLDPRRQGCLASLAPASKLWLCGPGGLASAIRRASLPLPRSSTVRHYMSGAAAFSSPSQFSSAAACPCGATLFHVEGKVLARFVCHCAICQRLYKAPYADVSAFWSGAVNIGTPASVEYKKYRPPPALRRGTCTTCGAPVAGFMWFAPSLRVAFVPSRNLSAAAALPPPDAHIFYHRRAADALDDLPKHSGYWRSEFAVTSLVVKGIAR